MAFKPNNLAELRAIHASQDRGVDVPLAGGMRPLKPKEPQAPKSGMPVMASARPPVVPAMPSGHKPPRVAGRKYYGER